MISGIVCDDYKVNHFKVALDAAGYSYTEHPGVTKTTRLIRVVTDPEKIAPLALLIQDLERRQPWFKNANKG